MLSLHSPPRQLSPIRPRCPDQPGPDPIWRAIWAPDSLRPTFARPSCVGRRAISRPPDPLSPTQRSLRHPASPSMLRCQGTLDARPASMARLVPPLNPAQRVSRPSGRLRTACQPAHADRPGTPGTRAPAPRSVPGGRPPRDDPQPSAHIPPMSGEFRTGRWDPSADKTRGTWGTGIGGTRQYEATRSPAIEEWLRR